MHDLTRATPPDLDALHARTRNRGVSPIAYWALRVVLQPFFHLYFRLRRVGVGHVPRRGPVNIAANHRLKKIRRPPPTWIASFGT